MPNTEIRVRRSALYMPCSNQRALEKATGLDADVLLFDLEDAVAPDHKIEARNNIVEALATFDYGRRERIVRINGLDSPWGIDDLKALQNSSFDGVLIPKTESIEQINQALAVLDKTLPVWVMIETAKGVLNVETIARHPQVKVLVLGTNDLAKEMRVQQSTSRQEFFYAFGLCVLAARAWGCDILDGVYNTLDDEQGLASLCEQGRMLGFDGKTVIHPKQLAVCNRVFMPSADEITQAQTIISAWREAKGAGVIVVNGKLVEALHVEQAERIVAIHQLVVSTS